MAKASVTFMGKSVEDNIHLVLVTLSKERARLTQEEYGIVPTWLESSIYQLELALAHLEGNRLAAKGLQATVEEIMEILKEEDRRSGSIPKALQTILKRFDKLLRIRGSDEEERQG